MIMAESKPGRVCDLPGRVASNAPICTAHAEIELLVPGFPVSQPGQFVQLQCCDPDARTPRVLTWALGDFPSPHSGGELGRREAFLRRPFSIADQWRDDDGRVHVVVVSRTVGPGTAWLERLAPGDNLSVTGPLGHGFEIPGNDAPIALVGGGVGIPPLAHLARRLDEQGRRDVTAFLGATTQDLLPLRLSKQPARDGTPQVCAEMAGAARFPAAITTDDGSCGLHGVVTDALAKWHADRVDRLRNGATVFACGPEAMLEAIAALTRELGLDCQLCIERKMGCGLGTCQSCIVRVRDETRPAGWRWALTCEEGPVFDRDQLYE